ncbi:MAG: hypothetical protein LQ340_007187 [Diploschistes diacapsis]|nr:MAG: hypothetical protein LQ340_007187 [Diploschistes diacapsis]
MGDTIIETPLKRNVTKGDSPTEASFKKNKLNHAGSPGQQSFNSQESAADDLFTDYDTVATLPNVRPPYHPATQLQTQLQKQSQYMSQNTYVTQPTQIIHDYAAPSTPQSNRVQVPASSPTPHYSHSPAARGMTNGYRAPPSYNVQPSGTFGSSIAPPGTSFRAPKPFIARQAQMQPQAHWQPVPAPGSGGANALARQYPGKQYPENVIDLEEDQGMVYKGGYSDDESQNARDIKPSVVKSRNVQNAPAPAVPMPDLPIPKSKPKANLPVPQQNSASARFGNILASSIYIGPARSNGVNMSPPAQSMKRSADLMASAYGGRDRPERQPRLARTAQMQPEPGLKLEDISDFGLRSKIERVMSVLPSKTVKQIRDMLFLKKGNEQDAMDALVDDDPKPKEIDLTLSSDVDDDELSFPVAQPTRTTTKQQLKAPVATLRDRYGMASQAPAKATPKPQGEVPSAKPKRASPEPFTGEAPSKRRRLMKGRKHQSSPVASSPITIPIDDNSDSGIDARSASEDAGVLDSTLLSFFNTCNAGDIVDMANITKAIAEHIVASRPYKNLSAVRAVKEPDYAINPKARKQKRTVGDKVVDVCETMWQGYQAVDQLVQKCKDLRKPITEGMKRWGVDVIGASKDGEIELVNLDGMTKSPSVRDSGIGTPTTSSGDEDFKSSTNPKSLLLLQPETMSKDITLKDYQVIGMNWLNLLFRNRLSCILADDMGLGKTCQVIAFMAHLYETGVKGPHVIIVPGSTLENWLREFETFCPGLPVMSYYGSQAAREEYQMEIKEKRPYVVVTTYSIATQRNDRKFFTKLEPVCGVFDEGHMLKDCKTNKHVELMKIPTQFRLLLTGTPLQNNLTELMSLLNFIMPNIFKDHKDDLEVIFKHRAKTNDENHDALLSAQRIARARTMMAPFILRRKKDQVLQNLPQKTSRVEYCDLTDSQRSIYQEYLDEAARIVELRKRAKETKESVNKSSNVLTDLRKACLHPLLFRRKYTNTELRKVVKSYLRNPKESERSFELCMEDMEICSDHNIHRYCLDENNAPYMAKHALPHAPFLDSGKVTKLVELLKQYKANGDRVLIFSQFVMVLDILEEVLSGAEVTFYRIDGATPVDERQPLIDQFYADDSVTAFMLSTKAGGAGINLAAANKVIIFDSSFNPQDDIQAENRAHRVGQKRDVEVIRLVSKGTVEEQIYALGQSKVLLDARVAGDEGKKAEAKGEKMIKEALEKQIMEGKVDIDVEKKEEEKNKAEMDIKNAEDVPKTKKKVNTKGEARNKRRGGKSKSEESDETE